jgi:hypothetical protein
VEVKYNKNEENVLRLKGNEVKIISRNWIKLNFFLLFVVLQKLVSAYSTHSVLLSLNYISMLVFFVCVHVMACDGILLCENFTIQCFSLQFRRVDENVNNLWI